MTLQLNEEVTSFAVRAKSDENIKRPENSDSDQRFVSSSVIEGAIQIEWNRFEHLFGRGL